MAYGSGAMSNTLADVAEEAAAVFLIGSNPTEQHPVFGTRLRQAVRKRRMPLVVADPRAIGLTEFAALHLRHWPGTDVALLNGLMHIILAKGWHDAQFIAQRTEDFSAWQHSLAAYTPARVSAITRVSEVELTRAASLLAHAKPMAVIWAMGITQHTSGVLNVLALANLQMLLGNVGMRGGGVNPLREQNNVQALAIWERYRRVHERLRECYPNQSTQDIEQHNREGKHDASLDGFHDYLLGSAASVRLGAKQLAESDPWNEPRRSPAVRFILLAECFQHILLLRSGQANIHPGENREHQQGKNRRPLQEEAGHDENERNILRMPDVRVEARRRQTAFLLRLV
ncbi:protein of unknown function (plasmid) [Cupriavidus taiwanensis]|uniref:Molybdopterin oxidoreductase domain-containing protein n=1 Tax=Cupriavidus taiwanensis TaxID=164546 RepID=A0A375IV22_9BURK|nr:protein of unknown function [Cupriavidus taiwanensis]